MTKQFAAIALGTLLVVGTAGGAFARTVHHGVSHPSRAVTAAPRYRLYDVDPGTSGYSGGFGDSGSMGGIGR